MQSLDYIESTAGFKPIPRWWGDFHFELNQSRTWQLGSLILRLTRLSNEWRLEYYRPIVQHDQEQFFQKISEPDFALPQPVHVERFMFRQTGSELFLMPHLAPRSVVIKPTVPVYIPAGQSTTLFISTPLWVRGFIHHHEDALFELPIIRPKETWFGQNKQKGELCYATSVDARTSLDLLTPRAFRAVTPVRVQNNSLQQLKFERMNVPVTALPLFYSESLGRLLTSHIQVSYSGREHSPKIRIGQRSLESAGVVERIHQGNEQMNFANIFDLWA